MSSAVGENDDLAKSLETHRKFLLRYAHFHLREPSLAEDAVQETFIAALAHRDSFQGRSQLRTWLTGILKHKVIDMVRRRSRALPDNALPLGEDDNSTEDTFNTRGKWIDPPADWGLPDAALESDQFWRVFEKCCKRMPERHALAFSMREVMEMSTEEICNKLEISTSNLHVILYRARLSLRSCMTRNWFGTEHG